MLRNMRRAVVAVIAVSMTMVLTLSSAVSAAPAVRDKVADTRPNPKVILRGGGWGHSVGMSQYGAYAQSRAGRAYRTILRHYYPGVTVAAGTMPSSIRVGLSTGMTLSDVDAVGGPVRWRVCGDGGCTTLDQRQPAGTTWSVRVLSDGRFRLSQGSTVIWRGGQGERLVAAFNPRASATGTQVVAYNPNGSRRTYKWGKLEYSVRSTSARTMYMVLDIPSVELYLRGLGEVPSYWGTTGGMAALKVQATAARTYAVRLHRLYNGNRSDCRCSLLATPADQVYLGYGKETETYGSYWVNAVTKTSQNVATHNGSLIQTYYSSSHGGRSENVEDSWAFGTTPLPYLRSVADPWSQQAPGNTFASWERPVGNKAFGRFAGGGVAQVRRVRLVGRTDGGSPRNLVVTGLTADGRTVKARRSGAKGIVGIDMRYGFDYPARSLPSLPSQQVRTAGFGPFLDDDGAKNEYAIVFVTRARILKGTSATTFSAGRRVTRAAGARALYRTFQVAAAPKGADYYRDDDGHWAEKAINSLAHAGVTGGKKSGEFNPGRTLKRRHLERFLNRLGAKALPRAYFDGKGSYKVKRGHLAKVLLTVVERYR